MQTGLTDKTICLNSNIQTCYNGKRHVVTCILNDILRWTCDTHQHFQCTRCNYLRQSSHLYCAKMSCVMQNMNIEDFLFQLAQLYHQSAQCSSHSLHMITLKYYQQNRMQLIALIFKMEKSCYYFAIARFSLHCYVTINDASMLQICHSCFKHFKHSNVEWQCGYLLNWIQVPQKPKL